MRRISHNSSSEKAPREFIKNTYKSRQQHFVNKYICGTRLIYFFGHTQPGSQLFLLPEWTPIQLAVFLSRWSNLNFTSGLPSCRKITSAFLKTIITLEIFSLMLLLVTFHYTSIRSQVVWGHIKSAFIFLPLTLSARSSIHNKH